jgi:hypothetical protein
MLPGPVAELRMVLLVGQKQIIKCMNIINYLHVIFNEIKISQVVNILVLLEE